jgi:hypothetical protein
MKEVSGKLALKELIERSEKSSHPSLLSIPFSKSYSLS